MELYDGRGGNIRSVQVSSNVDMLSTSSIVTWVIGSKLSYSILVGGLDSSLEGGVDVLSTAVVSIGDDTTVDTSGICLPELDYFHVSHLYLARDRFDIP